MTRVTGIGVEERQGRRRVTHVDTDRGRITCDVVVNAGGMFAHELGRMVGVNVPVVPMAHQYALTRPSQPIPKDLPTMRDPDRLVYFREEVGGLVVGGYERDPDPWCVDGPIPPTFNNTLLPPDWDRFLPLTEAATTLVPCLADAEVTQLINGPEAFTPDGEFILGESEVAGFFVAAGLLRPRHRRRRRQRPGHGRVDRRRRATGRPLEDGHPALRRPVPQPGLRAGPHLRGVQHLLRHRVPQPRASGRPAAAPPAGLHPPRRAGRGAGREERLGAGQLVLVERRPGARGPAAAGLGRAALVDGHRDRAPRLPRGRGTVRRVELRQDRGQRSRVPRPSSRACARTTSTSGSARSPTRRCSTPAAASSATSPSPGSRTSASSSSPARRSAATTSSWIRSHLPAAAPDAGPVAVSDVTSSMACFGLWGPMARDILTDVCRDDLGFRYMQRPPADRRRRALPRRCGSRTSASSAGSCIRRAEYGLRLWDTLMEAGQPTAWSPAATAPSTRCGWRRATGSGASDITSETDPFSAGLGFAVRLEKGDFVGRDAAAPLAPDGGPQRLACLVLDDPRSVALGNEPVKDGLGRRRPGHVGRRRLLARAVDRLRVAAGRADRARARASSSRSSARPSMPRSARTRSTTPRASASAPEAGQRPLRPVAAGLSLPRARRRRPGRPRCGDEPGRRVGHGRELHAWAQVHLGEALEELRRPTLGDAGGAVDDEVLVEPHGVALVSLDGERDPRVTPDVADLLVLVQVGAHDLVAVEAHPHQAHLGAAVRPQGHEVAEAAGLDERPRGVGECGHGPRLRRAADVRRRRAAPPDTAPLPISARHLSTTRRRVRMADRDAPECTAGTFLPRPSRSARRCQPCRAGTRGARPVSARAVADQAGAGAPTPLSAVMTGISVVMGSSLAATSALAGAAGVTGAECAAGAGAVAAAAAGSVFGAGAAVRAGAEASGAAALGVAPSDPVAGRVRRALTGRRSRVTGDGRAVLHARRPGPRWSGRAR